MGSYGARGADVDDVRANQRTTSRRLPARFEVPVVGVSHRNGYPGNLQYVADLLGDAELARALDPGAVFVAEHARVVRRVIADGLVRVTVRAEPDNPVDPDAVAVDLTIPGEPGLRLGYVPATTHGRPASRLASELRVGHEWGGWVAQVRINPAHRDQPGADVVLQRKAPL